MKGLYEDIDKFGVILLERERKGGLGERPSSSITAAARGEDRSFA